MVSAATHLELKAPESLQTLRPAVGPDQDTLLSDGGIARQDIPVKLVIEPQAKGGPRLAWNVTIDVKGQKPFVCLPNPTPPRQEILQGFVVWTGSHPEYAQDVPVETLIRYLVEKYPCPK